MPKTNKILPRTEPANDALTTSKRPARIAKYAIINSVALPKVAFKKPPNLGPVYTANSSVASPR